MRKRRSTRRRKLFFNREARGFFQQKLQKGKTIQKQNGVWVFVLFLKSNNENPKKSFLFLDMVIDQVHQQDLTKMKELQKFQNSTFDTLARRKLIEDQNTIMELSGRLQELQNEVNCMNDSKDFQDAESVRSGNSHVTSRPVLFPKHPIPEGMLRPSFVSPRRKEGPPCIWDTHGISGNVFANPDASSSAPYPQQEDQGKLALLRDQRG